MTPELVEVTDGVLSMIEQEGGGEKAKVTAAPVLVKIRVTELLQNDTSLCAENPRFKGKTKLSTWYKAVMSAKASGKPVLQWRLDLLKPIFEKSSAGLTHVGAKLLATKVKSKKGEDDVTTNARKMAQAKLRLLSRSGDLATLRDSRWVDCGIPGCDNPKVKLGGDFKLDNYLNSHFLKCAGGYYDNPTK